MESYNGYPNYESWLIAVHIDNDEAMLVNVQNLCKTEFEFEFEKADSLKEMIEEYALDNIENVFVKDLISATISNVDWKYLIEQYKKD